MFKQVRIALLVVAGVLVFSFAALAAPRSFTVKGRIVDPDGKPVVGAPLQLTPLTPTTGWDVSNSFYKIPNYDWHRTVSDENGEFVMTNVIDYPENHSHRYLIQALGGYKGLHIVLMISLPTAELPKGQEYPALEYVIKAQEAAQLTVFLKDSNGKPYNGKKVLFIQAGHNVTDGRYGVGITLEATFRDGIYRRAQVIKPDRYGRIAVLEFDTEEQMRTTMLAKGLKIYDSTDSFAFALKDAAGKPVSVETNWFPGDMRVEFQLP